MKVTVPVVLAAIALVLACSGATPAFACGDKGTKGAATGKDGKATDKASSSSTSGVTAGSTGDASAAQASTPQSGSDKPADTSGSQQK